MVVEWKLCHELHEFLEWGSRLVALSYSGEANQRLKGD
jgi:hypothetical protein